jgi:RNA polymerase sigma-70 factor (ECF subfamily)
MEHQLDPARLGDHLDRLYRAAWALSGSREDAEDLVQETYARVLARPRLLRNEDDLGYLLRALRNTFLTQKRTESRRLRPGPLPEQLDLVADPQAREPEAAVEAAELYAAVASLPGDFRDVLVAVDITGLSYKETARALRIREGTVMSRLYRARQQVVRQIEGGSAPSARSRVTVSVLNCFGETPAQSVTFRPSLNVPIGTSTPARLRSQAS